MKLLETDHETTLRTTAPVAIVWDELCTLDRLLENLPDITAAELSADGERAILTGWLSRWPSAWRSVPGTAELMEVLAPERLRWTLLVPSLQIGFEGTFELTPVAHDETCLTYRGVLRCGDPNLACLRRVMAGRLEDHLDYLASRIATRAERRALAERTLGRELPSS